MKRDLLVFKFLLAVLVLPLQAYSETEVDAPAEGTLPDEVLAVVMTAPPKTLAENAVAVARQFRPGPQTESLPFIVGGFLGDPTLEGVSQTENVGLVLLGLDDEEPSAVLVMQLPDDSPWRQTLPGFDLELRDAGGWTFAARDPAHLEAAEGLEDKLIEVVTAPRSHDIVASVNPARLASALGELDVEDFELDPDEIGIDLEPLAKSLTELGARELGSANNILFGFDAGADEIGYVFEIAARPGTQLARLFSHQRAEEIPYARFLSADAPLTFLGGVEMAAIQGYLEYLVNELEEEIPLAMRPALVEFMETFRYFGEKTDGASAGQLAIEGIQPDLVQVTGARFGQDELLDYLRNTVRLMTVFDDEEDPQLSYELLEGHLAVDDIPVHVLRTVGQTDFDMPDDTEFEMPEGFGMEDQEQDFYYAVVDGVLLTTTDADRIADLIRVVRDGEEAPGNIGETIQLRPDELFRMRFDIPSYLRSAMEPMAMFDEGAAQSLERLGELDLEAAHAWLSAHDGTMRFGFSLPVASAAEAFRFFQENMAMGAEEPEMVIPPMNGDEY